MPSPSVREWQSRASSFDRLRMRRLKCGAHETEVLMVSLSNHEDPPCPAPRQASHTSHRRGERYGLKFSTLARVPWMMPKSPSLMDVTLSYIRRWMSAIAF
jgi:hypothetical protein